MSHKRFAYCLGANGPRSSECNPLKYAEKDAERIASALLTYPCNFTDADWRVAADRKSTLAGLSSFIRQCQSSDLLVVHYSGHAILDEELYLLCNETDCDDLVSSAIEISAIKKILSRSPASYNILVLDCCHAGGAYREAFKGVQEIEDALNRAFQGSANVILSACARHEQTRELGTLDGGAGFLSWVLAVACTTRFQEVSYDGRSLSLANILRWLPIVLEEINRPLNENERLPLPEALIYIRGGAGEIWFTEPGRLNSSERKSNEWREREHRLKAMLADHSGFMRNRLSSFVGRVQELAATRQRIAEKMLTGGYVTITGHPGQGKSSIIAKLVEENGVGQTAFHFIPLNPGPDHQVNLLRNLMARLILKYDLSDLYVATESRAALRDYFPKVLNEIIAMGGQEIIFIDGLDQLEVEITGTRDLSFLPNNPPPGIVFVLGTRPNDTLQPLELLKPSDEYTLPNLTRHDFNLILQNHHVTLESGLADRFYHAMQENALYLDLVAGELARSDQLPSEEIIARLTDNPENIFSFTMNRLRLRENQWDKVIKPLLGALLVAQEPLTKAHLRQLITVDADKLNLGLERLGGLVIDDGRQRYSLFHLKFREYLLEDLSRPQKQFIFVQEEEEQWHKRFTQWCEFPDLALIWEDKPRDNTEQGRREYARHHYVTHLYYAHEGQRLFTVLDAGEYGRAKLEYDPSLRLYIQDLEFGRRAAAWEKWTFQESLEHLPHLWRYTLLQCSLASRADKYPPQAFQLLLMIGQEAKALGLAELLVDPSDKVEIMILIATDLATHLDRKLESVQIFNRAFDIASSILSSREQAAVLSRLGTALAQAQQWEEAKRVIRSINYVYGEDQATALSKLGAALAQAQRRQEARQICTEAERVINTIWHGEKRARAWIELAVALTHLQQWQEAEQVIHNIEGSEGRARALRKLGVALTQAQEQGEARRVWSKAKQVIRTIYNNKECGETLIELGVAFAQAQEQEEAQRIWREAEQVIDSIWNHQEQVEALSRLGSALAQAQQWEEAERIWSKAKLIIPTIRKSRERTESLIELGVAFAQAQEQEEAQRIWREAEQVIDSTWNHQEQAEALSRLGSALAQAQQWEEAERVIRSIESNETQVEVLSELGIMFARANQWEEARRVWGDAERIIRTVEHYESHIVEILPDFVAALIQAQQWDEAEHMIYTIKDNKWQVEALSDLGLALTRAQQWEKAERVIRSIEEDEVRFEGLGELGTALAQAQQWEEAKRVIRSIKNKFQWSVLWSELGAALAQVQQWEEARKIWAEEEQVIQTIKDNESQARALCKLGRALAQAQQWEEARRVWRKADQVIGRIKDTEKQSNVSSELGAALVQAQQWVEAERVIRSIKHLFLRAKVMSELGVALAQTQQWAEAERLIRAIEDDEARISALHELGMALIQGQQWAEAERVVEAIWDVGKKTEMLNELRLALAQMHQWAEAEQVIRMIKDNEARCEALSELGLALAQTQRWEEARRVWAEAERVISSIRDNQERAFALSELGAVLAQAQKEEEARRVWAEAERVVQTIGNPSERIWALSELGAVLAQAQKEEEARKIWDGVERVLNTNEDDDELKESLPDLVVALARAQQWEIVDRVFQAIWNPSEQDWVLSQLGVIWAKAQLWEEAEQEIQVIEDDGARVKALNELETALVQAQEWNFLLNLVQNLWKQTQTLQDAFKFLPLAFRLIPLKPEIGIAFYHAFTWVENFLRG